MRERLSLGLLLGQVGNGLFIIFTVIVYIYYFAYEPGSVVIKGMEITAYIVEICGFASLAYADFLLIEAVRMRKTMKAGFTFYIIMEVVMMIMELNSYRLEFYEPYSLALAIIHSIVSAAVCFSFLQLDPDKKPYEIIITICVGIIFGGMLGNIIGIRIYFSICMNAIAFTLLFGAIRFMLRRETIEIDCHGDRARVAEYKSSFFDDKDEKNEND